MKTYWILISALWLLACQAEKPPPDRDELVRRIPSRIPLYLDHINLAVNDLDYWQAYFVDSLGFFVKEGRKHSNGINNAFVEFENETELELITAPDSLDSLSGWYKEFISEGDGGAFLALRPEEARWMDSLEQRFIRVGIKYERSDFQYADLLSLHSSEDMHPLFFIHYKYPNPINPANTRHPNHSLGIKKVGLSRHSSYEEVYKALGWLEHEEEEVQLILKNGEIEMSTAYSGFGRISFIELATSSVQSLKEGENNVINLFDKDRILRILFSQDMKEK